MLLAYLNKYLEFLKSIKLEKKKVKLWKMRW